jgi:hypothetical protein
MTIARTITLDENSVNGPNNFIFSDETMISCDALYQITLYEHR